MFGRLKNKLSGSDRTVYGICTTVYKIDDMSYERKRLYEEAQQLYDEVMLIDSRAVAYQLIRGQTKPIVEHHGRDISGLTALHVRNYGERGFSTAILTRVLEYCGCHISEPARRFSVGRNSKLLTSFQRFKEGIGTTTFIAFDYANAMRLVDRMDQDDFFPLLAKPISGTHGVGLEKLDDIEMVEDYIERFFDEIQADLDTPIFLQTFVEFAAEYRVYVLDKQVLGVALKHKSEGEIASNAARGGYYEKVDDPAVAEFAQQFTNAYGIYGVDIARDPKGDLHLIEANRSPEFKEFERATGVNVARYIVEQALKARESD